MTAATLPTREPTRTAAPRTTRTARTGSAFRQEVLDHPSRSASCTSHQPAAGTTAAKTRLAYARVERGWTKSQLIHQLRMLAGAKTLPGDESLNRMIAGWENQGRSVSDYYQGLLARAYGSTPNALGITPQPYQADNGPAGRPQYDVQVSFEGWDDGGYTSAGAPIGPVVREWSGAEAHALQQAMRLTNLGFAEKLGFGLRTVAGWRSDTTAKLRTSTQDILDAALRQASPEERQRFLQITRLDQGRDPLTPAPLTTPATTPPTTPATAPPTTSAAGSGDAAPVETSDDSTTACTDPENSACRCDSCRAYLADENVSSRPAARDETAPSQDAVARARVAVEQLQATAAAARQQAAQAARQAIEDERSRYHQHSTEDHHERVLEAA